ncbi:hypothetical protein ACS0TY_025357 [Phlomoides rotata]
MMQSRSAFEVKRLKPLFSCILIWVGFLCLVWLMFVAYYSFQIIETLSPNTPLHPKTIILLAGQSNVSGRGGVVNGTWEGVVPPECGPNPSILRLSAALRWEEAREPLHRDIDVDKTCGVGPGMAFSNSVLERDSGVGVIGLVPCAVGGTNISEWRRSSRLYNQLISRARAAVRGGGLIRAVLWYQGETDTIDLDNANLYKSRLEEFFTDVRSDLMSPMLPVILVALASGEGPYVDIIRKAQMEIEVPNVRIVDAMGLQLQPDELHLTTAAQVRLGPMLADAFLKITAPLPVQSSNAAKRFNNFFLGSFLSSIFFWDHFSSWFK